MFYSCFVLTRRCDDDLGFTITLLSKTSVAPARRRGRAATANVSGRFESFSRQEMDDGWGSLEQLPPFKTTVAHEKPKNLITRNDSPDISFDRSINPYRGCEHGCIYCFARPTHAYLGLSPGLISRAA